MTSSSEGGNDDGSSEGGHDDGGSEVTSGPAESGHKRRRRRRHRKQPGDAPRKDARQLPQLAQPPDSRNPRDATRRGDERRSARNDDERHRARDDDERHSARNDATRRDDERRSARDDDERRSARDDDERHSAHDDDDERHSAHDDVTDPRDATRGGVNGPALPVQRGRESPLSIELVAEFPPDPPVTDPDPVSFELADGPSASHHEDVTSLVGVRFVPSGRIAWCTAGDQHYAPGERVFVESDRGPRLAWVVAPPTRKPVVERGMRRVIRRATEHDAGGERADDAHHARALRVAKDAGAALKLPLKVFRVEVSGGKLIVYYTTEERLDVRDFARSVSQAMNMRIELRQIGGRDEAKLVGGIGSCGLPLCCTTWLPEFVPVSIKMAKDQGLVLSPSRVSGQCGRLKCCLVYEQEAYAELRKGLPKLGKRVVSERGEGRVVEVDVLTQRVRVSYAPGDTELLPASAVTPLFPSGAPSSRADHAVRSKTSPDGDSDDTDHDPDLRRIDDLSDEDSGGPT